MPRSHSCARRRLSVRWTTCTRARAFRWARSASLSLFFLLQLACVRSSVRRREQTCSVPKCWPEGASHGCLGVRSARMGAWGCFNLPRALDTNELVASSFQFAPMPPPPPPPPPQAAELLLTLVLVANVLRVRALHDQVVVCAWAMAPVQTLGGGWSHVRMGRRRRGSRAAGQRGYGGREGPEPRPCGGRKGEAAPFGQQAFTPAPLPHTHARTHLACTNRVLRRVLTFLGCLDRRRTSARSSRRVTRGCMRDRAAAAGCSRTRTHAPLFVCGAVQLVRLCRALWHPFPFFTCTRL